MQFAKKKKRIKKYRAMWKFKNELIYKLKYHPIYNIIWHQNFDTPKNEISLSDGLRVHQKSYPTRISNTSSLQ